MRKISFLIIVTFILHTPYLFGQSRTKLFKEFLDNFPTTEDFFSIMESDIDEVSYYPEFIDKRLLEQKVYDTLGNKIVVPSYKNIDMRYTPFIQMNLMEMNIDLNIPLIQPYHNYYYVAKFNLNNNYIPVIYLHTKSKGSKIAHDYTILEYILVVYTKKGKIIDQKVIADYYQEALLEVEYNSIQSRNFLYIKTFSINRSAPMIKPLMINKKGEIMKRN